MLKVLIVEDERPIADLVEMNLTASGYACTTVYDGIAAADLLEKNAYDLVLLDVMLPGLSGYDLMEQIRPLHIPVIFITAQGSTADRVRGLRAGADDYLVKPFEIVELIARVESVLRRAGKGDEHFSVGDVEVDVRSMQVTKGGVPVQLTRKEYDLLLLFVRNPNIALFRDTIYERVWESDFLGDSRTVDLHVQRLRKKLGWQDRLSAVYKVGYRLEVSK
ncbi:MAG TPA: response regulator transcription factor [Candidatus Avoscillospira avicola]|uniref:Stage 0 sporulation protein A homolog n=1 Tax=Candidatus Avoscillospira avicola TaxID=2840706 RepID=A0A9D1DHQ8_9FIRM|nr:response regulator transcription factor [Candidatus Avoscillospira avicola]